MLQALSIMTDFDLKSLAESDLPVLFEHQTDPVSIEMAVFPPRDRDAFMAHWKKNLSDPTVFARTVWLDAEIVGYVSRWIKDGRHLVGYWYDQRVWGNGLATAALRRFLSEDLVRPMYAFVAPTNRGSIRVLEKSGFKQEGPPRINDENVEGLLYRLDD